MMVEYILEHDLMIDW